MKLRCVRCAGEATVIFNGNSFCEECATQKEKEIKKLQNYNLAEIK